MMPNKYKQDWDKLINDILVELIKINELPQKSIAEIWVEGTLKSVIKRMCALHKLKPCDQSIDGIERELFTGLTASNDYTVKG